MLQEGSLKNGDHLLQVGEVRLWGMGAEQVKMRMYASSKLEMKEYSFTFFLLKLITRLKFEFSFLSWQPDAVDL